MPLPRSRWTPIGKTTVILAAIVLACNGDNSTDPPDPLDVRVFPAEVFAGGEVFLAGEWYRENSPLPQFTLDTFTLSVRRVDDSTVAVTVPSTLNGPGELFEEVASAPLSRGTVTIHGISASASIPLPVQTIITRSWWQGFPYVATGDSAGVSIINFRTNTATRYEGIGTFGTGRSSCPRAVGPTYLTDMFLLWTPGGILQGMDRWSLVPDTVHQGHVNLLGCSVAELSPGVFVFGDQMRVFLDSIDVNGNYTPFYMDTVVQADRFYPSPIRNRLAMNGFDQTGIPVLDLVTRSLAYKVPSVPHVTDAAFSSEGSRLYLSGQSHDAHANVIVRLDATTGDSLAARAFDQVSVIATDPRSFLPVPLLYVSIAERDPLTDELVPFILVLDQITLQTIGRIQLPSNTCNRCEETVLVVDDDISTPNLVLVYPDLSGVGVIHLSLLPVVFPPD